MGSKPVIGITASVDRGSDSLPLLRGRRVLYVNEDYVQAVRGAGGEAAILPLCPKDGADALDRLDGLLVTGNEKTLPRKLLSTIESVGLREQNPERYDSEAGWLRAALARGMPVLGICRGMQMLNDVLGGTLHRQPPLPDGRGHDQAAAPEETWHTVTILPESKLARALGTLERRVNSMHLQGVCEPGRGLIFTAFAPGGGVEALEAIDRPFVMGVQFHPERLIRRDPQMLEIFRALVTAAHQYQLARQKGGVA